MIGNLVRNWWTFVLQGLLATFVGVAAFVVPGPTLAALIAAFAAYAIVTGSVELVAGFGMEGGPKWSLVIGGVAGIAAGILTVAWPQTTAVTVTLLVGVYAIVTGVVRSAAAYMVGNLGQTWLLALSGIASVILGVLLIADPGTGVLGVLWLIGSYAIFAGISAIAFGLRLRGIGKDASHLATELTANGATGTTAASR